MGVVLPAKRLFFAIKGDMLRSLVALCLFVPAAAACTCATAGTACDALSGTKIVFVGTVTEDSGEGRGTGPAKITVEEGLRGLPKGVTELTVDTHAGSSCYMRLQKGERYVIYGSPTDLAKGRVRREACSFSFAVKGNELLLAAIRGAALGTERSLAGRVVVPGTLSIFPPCRPPLVAVTKFRCGSVPR